MSTIVTRAGKGSPLTHTEVDSNFTNLNTDKLEKANNLSDLTNAATARTNLGVAIGTDVQAYDADLAAFAAKTAPTGAVVGTTDTQTLTNKTISADNNTISGIAASSFVLSNGSGNLDGSAAQKAIPSGAVVGTTDTQTLTNKTIDGASNTLTNLPLANITEPVRHSVRPSLLLDFANTKTLDPRITFTRGSTGTFYDGKTVAKAEENLSIGSEQFDGSAWSKVGSATVTANSTTAPDGASTADTLNGAAGSSTYIIQALVITSGLSYTLSVYAKANTTNFIQVSGGGSVFGTNVWANFDLSGGTVGSTGSLTTASIQSVGNGWYRCVITGSSTASSSANAFGIIPVESSSATRFPTNTSATSIYLWGAQLEQRSSVTAYTPTTNAPITNYIPALQTAGNNVPRFEHNPVTGESLGLEIEEQRSNLFTYSEDLSNAVWTKYSSLTVSSNSVVAPDGALTGDTAVPPASTGSFGIGQSYTKAASAITYTLSGYSKSAGYDFLIFRIDEGNSNGVKGAFNISTGAISTAFASNGTGWSMGTATINTVGNGWYRWSITFTTGATISLRSIIYVSNATGDGFSTPSYTANGFSGIYIWGAQLEAGSFATSYIPTVASQVTRSADRASMSNIGGLLNVQEGTLYVSGIAPAGIQPSGNSSGFAMLSDGTNNNRVRLIRNGLNTSTLFSVVSNSATQASITVSDIANSAFFKAAGAYKVNDFAGSINASAVGTDTSGSTPVVLNNLDIGHQGGTATTEINSSISKIAYYPKRLTNAELQGLTTV